MKHTHGIAGTRLMIQAMNRLFTGVLRIFSGDFKMTVTVDSSHDPKAPLARTDGQNVYVNDLMLEALFDVNGMKRGTYGKFGPSALLHAYRGLVYHELGHMLFSPFEQDRLNIFTAATTALRNDHRVGSTIDLHGATFGQTEKFVYGVWALAEEAREEWFLIQRWPNMSNYLRWLFAFECRLGYWGEAHPQPKQSKNREDLMKAAELVVLTWPRRYLPRKVRLRAEHVLGVTRWGKSKSFKVRRKYLKPLLAACDTFARSTRHDPHHAQYLANVCAELLVATGLSLPDAADGQASTVPEQKLLQLPMDTTANGDSTHKPGPRTNRDTSNDKGSDGEDTSGEFDDDDLDDGHGNGQSDDEGDDGDANGGKGDGDSDGDADGEGDSDTDSNGGGKGDGDSEDEDDGDEPSKPSKGRGTGSRNVIPKDNIGDLTDDLFDDLEDDAEVSADTESLGNQIRSIINQGDVVLPPERQWRGRNTPVTPDMLKTRERIRNALAPLVEQIDSYWDQHVDHGRLNVQHVVAAQQRSYDVFDLWVPDLADEASFEIVIAADMSGSMGASGALALSQAAWSIKSMCDALNQPCTVILYDDKMGYGYEPYEKADQGNFKHWGASGGTTPWTTIYNASAILTGSKKTHKLFLMMTDGGWYGSYDGTYAAHGTSVTPKQAGEAMDAMNGQGVQTTFVYYGGDARSKSGMVRSYKFKDGVVLNNLDVLVSMATLFVRNSLKKAVTRH